MVKKKVSHYSKEINEENRKDEADDVSSDSSAQSSDDSDDEGNKSKEFSEQVVIKELDVEINEKLKFTSDVYNFTICANMTKCCSPLQ